MKRVLSELPRHTRHIFGRPCEDVPILTEQIDERAFLFVVQAGADGDALGGVSWVERDLAGLLGRLERHVPSRLHTSWHFLLQHGNIAQHLALPLGDEQGSAIWM